ETETRPMEVVKTEKIEINPRDVVEAEPIRVIMQYGDLVVDLSDAEGNAYQLTGIETNINQLDVNDLDVQNELYKSILEVDKLGFEAEELRTGDFFVKMFDAQKTEIASEAMFEKYSLSPNWKDKLNIYIKPKENNISKEIFDVILRFKTFYLDDEIKNCSDLL